MRWPHMWQQRLVMLKFSKSLAANRQWDKRCTGFKDIWCRCDNRKKYKQVCGDLVTFSTSLIVSVCVSDLAAMLDVGN